MIQSRRRPCRRIGQGGALEEQPPFGGDNKQKGERVHETRICDLLAGDFGGPRFNLFLRQTKLTNQGISPTEIVIGYHSDLSGPVKVWGVPFPNGMKMAVDEINAAGGIHGRKIKLIIEDSGYDPKKAVLATQKLVEKDKIFSMVGGGGIARRCWPRRTSVLDAGITAAVSADRGRIHVQVRSGQAAGATEVRQPAALHRKHACGVEVHGRDIQAGRSRASCTRTTSTVRTCSRASKQQLDGDESEACDRSRTSSAACRISALRFPR